MTPRSAVALPLDCSFCCSTDGALRIQYYVLLIVFAPLPWPRSLAGLHDTTNATTQAEYEQYTIDQGREMEATHQRHKAESHALKARVQDLEGSFTDAARDEEV